MSTDFLLREQFVTDPSQVLSEYVRGARLAPEQASVANQLLYAVLATPRLLAWLRAYSLRNRGRPISRERFAADFGRAVVEHGGSHVVLALMRGAAEPQSMLAFEQDVVHVILQGFDLDHHPQADGEGGGGGGTDPFTGGAEGGPGHTSTGTNPGTGTGDTDPGTGTGTGGTEMSTGTGTGGTEMSTGTGGTEQSTGTGTGGTEQSTGTGDTEQSTGTGTDSDFGLFGSRYAMLTLEALTQYAIQLRSIGALDVVFAR
jgi:hypothetical protein